MTNNKCYDELWDKMQKGIRDGNQISDAVTDFRYIPANVASMIASGDVGVRRQACGVSPKSQTGRSVWRGMKRESKTCIQRDSCLWGGLRMSFPSA